MFRRSSKPETTAIAAAEDQQPAGGRKPATQAPKGYATPSRKEAEAARKARLGALPADPKERRKAERGQRNTQFQRERQAVRDGDEKNYPPRDFGPARKFARDYVDGRLRLIEFAMPLVVLSYVIVIFDRKNTGATLLALYVIVLSILIVMIAGSLLARRVKRAVAAQFGEDHARGVGLYSFSRAVSPRPTRKPRPKVTITGKPKPPKA